MHLLSTDGYKLSMAEAGWPLRVETFHYTHRKGGPFVVPFDVRAELERLLPRAAPEDYAYLASHEYEMGAGFKAAIAERSLVIRALPKGAWFLPREPVFSVTGPSALVSWLEPLVLQLHYRIQVATVATLSPGTLRRELGVLTCEAERDIVEEVLDAVSVRPPPLSVDADAYHSRVKAAATELASVVGDPSRLFEVGLRAASCPEQHDIALAACKAAGITRTSHVRGARAHGLTPVGTMGHEHVQRFGGDEAAFRAMRDRRPGRSSYLLDTFDTIRSGIPAALRLILEQPGRGDSIRYDSGDQEAQYRVAVREAARAGLRPVHILEDGFDAPRTARFEALRRELGVAADEQFYGYGGHLVATPSGSGCVRDRVAAVYKLSQSGPTPTMKFGDAPGAGKESVPGHPVVFRRVRGDGPLGVVGQLGESPPDGYVALTGAAEPVPGVPPAGAAVAYSAETARLVARLRAERAELLRAADALAADIASPPVART